jgi:acetyl esterase
MVTQTERVPLHPVIDSMLQAARAAGRAGFASGSVAQARALLAQSSAALGPGPEVGRIEDLRVPTRDGAIAARLFHPAGERRGSIVHAHGGGWALGTLQDFDALARTLVHRTGCALLLIDYRLAPEHPFPAAVHDTEDALLWARSEDGRHRLGDGPLFASGDSAGANLVTVALAAVQPRVQAALQVLFYPVTDCSLGTAGDAQAGLPLTPADMRWFFGHYAPPSAWTDPRIAPLRSERLHLLPPAWIGVPQHDVLHDEGVAYAQRLRAAGVPTQLREFAGLVHGFARMFNHVDTADAAVAEAAAAIVRTCADPAPATQDIEDTP